MFGSILGGAASSGASFGPVGAAIGGVLGALGSRSASKKQRQAMQQVGQVAGQTRANIRNDWSPYSQIGGQATGMMSSQLNELTRRFGASDFTKDPGYDFRLKEGQTVLEGGAAARGGLYSGAAGKALTRYGQDFASNEFDKAYGRFTNDQNSAYNKLMGLIGVGTQAAGATSQAEQNYGNTMTGALTGAGNAAAAGTMGATNAITGGISGAIGAYQDNRLLDLLEERNRTFNGGNLGSFGSWRRPGGYPGEEG